MSKTFHVNWHVYGAVSVVADSREAAEKIVREASLSTLSNFGCPDYELDAWEESNGNPESGSGWTAEHLRTILPQDSMAELIGAPDNRGREDTDRVR